MRHRGTVGTLSMALAMVIVAVMVTSGLGGAGFSSAATASPNLAHAPRSATAGARATSGTTPWTYPTTTLQEPGYTGGTYILAATTSVEHLNIYGTTDAYSFQLLQEIYDGLNTYTPNQTYIPWAASSYSEATAPVGMTYFSPMSGTTQPVQYIWTVHIRPGIEWTDWTPATASSTYTLSNHTTFSLYNKTTSSPQPFVHTYGWPSMAMNTETMQSADVILSWMILATSSDYSGSVANIVNVVPVNNLTVQFYLSAQSATFLTYTLGIPILPYHLWVQHDWATSNIGAWNYTGAANGYDAWTLGYNPSTGTAPGLVGSGPFMFNGGYGEPTGRWILDQYWSEYVNPHYFVQYTPGLTQWTPKFFELYTPQYLSESAAATAESLGQVDTIERGLPPTFIPTIDTMPSTYIFYKPSTGYGYLQLNSYASDAPYNITAFRQALNYATDKAYLASVVNEGYDVLGQPIVPTSDAIWHNYSAPSYSFNPTLAEQMIAAIPGMAKDGAGDWAYHGTPVTGNIQITVASENPLGVEAALIVANEWTNVGVPTVVTQESFATLVSNLITYNYQAIDLGLSGISGDPTGDFFPFYNMTLGLGSGFYLGPFSSLTVNGVLLNGTQVDNLMGTLVNELNTNTTFSERLSLADQIEGIAAQEATLLNFGYPIEILPITNSTFTGIVRDSLPYLGFMYWNFMSLHLKGAAASVTPPSHIPTQLHVGVTAPKTVYLDGHFSNITAQVRTQYGAPVAGANVSLSYSPTGALLNITSYSGVTNAAGQYVWEFQVLPSNPLTYTSDYSGELNISVSARAPAGSSGVFEPGIGWTFVDVAPQAIAYSVSGPTLFVAGTAAQMVSLTVYDPGTGAPVAGYGYTIQALSGAVNLTTTSPAQSLVQTTSFSPIFGAGYASVMVGATADYGITSVSGVTGSNGLIEVMVAANGSVNFTAMGASFETYLFLGNYAAGAPVSGGAPWATLAEMTTAANPNGFGVQQPVEIPITVASASPNVTLTITPSSTNVSYNSTASLTVTATNSTGAPVPGVSFTLTSQNALGANRGLLSAVGGSPVQAPNPNAYFGSASLMGLTLTTNASGMAVATFSPAVYATEMSGGAFVGYGAQPYTDPYLVPFDEFELSAVGTTGTVSVSDAVVTSPAFIQSVSPVSTATAYIQGSGSLNGFILVPSNATYTLFVNTTLGGAYGPSVGGVPVNVSVSVGSLAASTGTTSASGSFSTTFATPLVSVLTPVTVRLTFATATGENSTVSQLVYLAPTYVTTHST
ncbi:MAG: ABC transporter substrate-binding protein, partial [Thermoplasmata archaeon]